jgi:DNA replication protein DnaC
MERRVEGIFILDYEVPVVLSSLLFWLDAWDGQIDKYSWLKKGFMQYGFDLKNSAHGIHEYINAQRQLWPDQDECGICGGLKEKDDEYGRYYCLCDTMRRKQNVKPSLIINKRSIESVTHPASLNDLKLRGQSQEAIHSLKDAIEITRKWIEHPTTWLAYSGTTGCGKTHMLSAMYTAWRPWSCYIVSSDFENRLRASIEDNFVEQVINALKNVPILFIDDLGIEYQTEWILQKMDDLIEFRSRESNWRSHVTVIATNLKPTTFRTSSFVRNGVSRIGSRLASAKHVRWVGIKTDDYRKYND